MLKHDIIEVRHNYKQSPETVFAAFSKKEFMQVWASPADGILANIPEFSFKEGGKIITHMEGDEAGLWVNTDRIIEILPNQRIIQHSDLTLDGVLSFAGVVTLEFNANELGGCEIIVTESGVFLDSEFGSEMHIGGWTAMLNNIGMLIDG